MNLFGFKFFNSKKDAYTPSFDIPDVNSSEVVETSEFGLGGINGIDFKNSESFQNEKELIYTYRELAKTPEIGLALNEIRNETFIFDDVLSQAVELRFASDTILSEALQTKITNEFKTIYKLLDFNNRGYEYLEDWYVDSKIFFHKIVDINNLKAGIKKIIKLDSLKIRKITEYPKPDFNGIYDLSQIKNYYIYSDEYDLFKNNTKNFYTTNTKINGLKIGEENITYCDSGLYDRNKKIVIGFLDKTIVPYNNLKLMEESLLIYRIVRSPERRVFYIDVGNLPRVKSEQYLKEMMNKFKSKLTYDSKTGTIVDRTNVLSMVEDYWIPRKSGAAGSTEITQLSSGDNTGITSDVQYFKDKFLRTLNIPVSRFQDEPTVLTYGATTTEITRDEYRFKKFIDILRKKFSFIFEDILKTQLILKNIITLDEWDDLKNDIRFVYAEDNNFVEFKELEILTKKLAALDAIDDKVGKYFSEKWVMENILKMSIDQIKTMKIEIANKDKEFANLTNNKTLSNDLGLNTTTDLTSDTSENPDLLNQTEPQAL